MDQNFGHRPGLLKEISKFFRQGSVLSVFILCNVAVWVLIQAFRVIFFLFNQPDSGFAMAIILRYFALPASVPFILEKPWTLFTYMFLHIDFWHVLFNMLWLFWFGKIFLEYLSGRQLFWVYILGGLSGGAVYILAFNVFPVFIPLLPLSTAIGASASVMAIVTAISFHVPNFTIQLLFLGRMKIIYLAIALFIFDFFMIPTGNPGGHIAHIGGALFGLIYSQLVPGNNIDRIRDFFQSKNPSSYGSGYSQRPVTDEEYNLRKKENQNRIDEILEKISKGGYDSLSKDEKEFLFKTSTKK